MSRSDGGPSAYQAAMAREQARLDAARKRSLHEASVHGEAHDDVESAWDSVCERRSRPPTASAL